MLFKGTEHRESLSIAQDISSIGGNINAYTSFDRTVYYINCPSGGLTTANEILQDIVFNALIPEEEFKAEQEVIRREISMGRDDADKVASQEMFSTCYCRHPYGLPVIGYLENFNNLKRSDVQITIWSDTSQIISLLSSRGIWTWRKLNLKLALFTERLGGVHPRQYSFRQNQFS